LVGRVNGIGKSKLTAFPGPNVGRVYFLKFSA